MHSPECNPAMLALLPGLEQSPARLHRGVWNVALSEREIDPFCGNVTTRDRQTEPFCDSVTTTDRDRPFLWEWQRVWKLPLTDWHLHSARLFMLPSPSQSQRFEDIILDVVEKDGRGIRKKTEPITRHCNHLPLYPALVFSQLVQSNQNLQISLFPHARVYLAVTLHRGSTFF